MSRMYDNWEKLVGAVLNREELRRLALCESFSSSISTDFSSRRSFDSVSPSVTRTSSQKLDRSYLCSPRSFFLRDSKVIEFEEIRKATKNFQPDWFKKKNFQPDMILEKEGSVIIFKGWIHEHYLTAVKPGFGTDVAVHKLLDKGLVACLNEIYYLSELRHPNLVKLIGYCFCTSNNILVYESTPRGRLDNHLFGREHQVLPWATRIKVALGAARALAFLHGMEIPVIHRDFKSDYILLDDDFNAKLSDFGLAIDGPTGGMTHVETQVMGTLGYAAPEYMETGHLTTRCDVYGFGVVLVELITGLRTFDIKRPAGQQILIDWVKPNLGNKKKLLRLMDSRLGGQYPRKEAYEVARIGLQCANSDPKLRPRMNEVVAALEKL